MSELSVDDEIMELIVESGQGKSAAFEALRKARNGNYPAAELLLKKSADHLNAAHKVQTRLISMDEGAGKVPVTLLMVHAQDHLMNAMLANELVEEQIQLHKKIDTLTNL